MPASITPWSPPAVAHRTPGSRFENPVCRSWWLSGRKQQSQRQGRRAQDASGRCGRTGLPRAGQVACDIGRKARKNRGAQWGKRCRGRRRVGQPRWQAAGVEDPRRRQRCRWWMRCLQWKRVHYGVWCRGRDVGRCADDGCRRAAPDQAQEVVEPLMTCRAEMKAQAAPGITAVSRRAQDLPLA